MSAESALRFESDRLPVGSQKSANTPARPRRPPRRTGGPNARTPRPPGRSGHAPHAGSRRTGPAAARYPNMVRTQQVQAAHTRPAARNPTTARGPARSNDRCSRAAARPGTLRSPHRSGPASPAPRPATNATSARPTAVAPSPRTSRNPGERTRPSARPPTAPAARRIGPHRDCECCVRTRGPAAITASSVHCRAPRRNSASGLTWPGGVALRGHPVGIFV